MLSLKTFDIYRSAFDSSPDAILLVRNGAIALANPAAVALFAARKTGKLQGRYIEELFEVDFQPALLERIWHMLAEGGSIPLTIERIIRCDGATRDVESAMAISCDSDGSPILMITLRDVTDRLQVQEKLAALTVEQIDALTAHVDTLLDAERARSSQGPKGEASS